MRLSIRQAARGTATLAAIFLLIGRAAADDGTPMDMPDPVPPGMGVLAGSLVVDLKDSAPDLRQTALAQGQVSITIRPVDHSTLGTRFISAATGSAQTGLTRITGTEKRQLFFSALPPGEYDIVQRAAYMSNRELTLASGSRPLRFRIAPGTVTYIGAYVLRAQADTNLIGHARFSGGSIGLDDAFEDDRRQLYHARPDLRALAIGDAVNGGAILPAPGLAPPVGAFKADVVLSNVAAVKSSSGIPSDVIERLEAFRPSMPPLEPRAIRRVELDTSVTRDGKPPAPGGPRKLNYLASAPGYVYEGVTSKADSDRKLEYMPFIGLREHRVTHVDAKSLLALTEDKVVDVTLSDVTLPRFDDVMKPGVTWNMEMEFDSNTKERTAIQHRDRAGYSIVRDLCTTLDRQPAATLWHEFAGTMLTVSCQQPDSAANEMRVAYLEQYGVFVRLRLASTSAAAGTQTAVDFRVIGVEWANRKADAASAAGAAPDAE